MILAENAVTAVSMTGCECLLSQTLRFHWFSLNYLFLPLFINPSLFLFLFYFPLSQTSPFIFLLFLLFMISRLSLSLSLFSLFLSTTFCLLFLNFLQYLISFYFSFYSISLYFQRREISPFSFPFSYSVYCTKLIPVHVRTPKLTQRDREEPLLNLWIR